MAMSRTGFPDGQEIAPDFPENDEWLCLADERQQELAFANFDSCGRW